MAANVEPQEAEAIRDLIAEAGQVEVAERDFGEPRRFSLAELEDLRRGLEARLGNVESRLADLLGTRCPLELGSVRESSAEGLFEGDDGPLAAIRFDVGGQPAWLTWDTQAATRTVERSLGSVEGSGAARRLSPLECSMLESILWCVAEGVLASLGLEAAGASFAQSGKELGDWREGGPGATPHRVRLELGFEGPGGESTLVLLVPLERSDGGSNPLEILHVELPPHLAAVELDVHVRFGACRVQLDQLLALEVGDVIPLDARRGDPVEVTVDGHTFARGSVGMRQGRVAIKIEEFEHEPPEEVE